MTVTHRSVMTLFSAPESVYSHRARIVLAEKDIQALIEQVDRRLARPRTCTT
ncbi:MAG: hypothetical protein U5K43_11515 [Halofilum sp. (in: g-proteobacteria)]|nr:hypothetical protein [Halofilum sp. (in: g-proteobacteria)]